MIEEYRLRLIVVKEIQDSTHVAAKESCHSEHDWGSPVYREESREHLHDIFPVVDFVQRLLQGAHKSFRLAIEL